MSMFPTPQRFTGDLDQLVSLLPAWLPLIERGDRVDIWTVEAILAIAKRIDEMGGPS